VASIFLENLCSPDLHHVLNYFLSTVIYALNITHVGKFVCSAGFVLCYVLARCSNDREWGHKKLGAFYILSHTYFLRKFLNCIVYNALKVQNHRYEMPRDLFWTAPKNIFNRDCVCIHSNANRSPPGLNRQPKPPSPPLRPNILTHHAMTKSEQFINITTRT
jgi:hypothetical protein